MRCVAGRVHFLASEGVLTWMVTGGPSKKLHALGEG